MVSRSPIFRLAETAVLLGLLLGVAGCADPADGRSAEHTLELAAAGLEGVDRYGFRVKTVVSTGGAKQVEIESFEGEIVGHTKLKIKRAVSGEAAKAAGMAEGGAAPAARLKELQRMDKIVTYAKPEKRGVLTLRIELTAEAAKRDAAARIRDRFNRAALAAAAADQTANPAAKSVRQRGTPAAMRRAGGKASAALTYDEAMKQEIDRSRRELDAMLDSLSAKTVVLVTVDRATLLPLKLTETTVLQYEAAGRRREEQNVTSMEFGNFDGRP